MKSWQIHFAWAMVSAVACAVTWRAASSDVPAPVPPKRPLAAEGRAEVREAVPAASGPDDVPISFVIAAQAPTSPPEATSIEKIRAMIRSSEDYVAFNEAMKSINDRALKLQLAKEAFEGKNMNAIYWFMNNLQQLKGRDVAELFEHYLQTHSDSEDGAVAANVLGVIGDPGSMSTLQDAFQSSTESVRFAAAASLRQLGFSGPSDQMMAALARQFVSSDGALRRKAIERMTELDPQAAVPLMTRALRDSNGDVRLAAVNGLQMVPNLNYAALIEPLLADPNPDVARNVRDLLDSLKLAEK